MDRRRYEEDQKDRGQETQSEQQSEFNHRRAIV
jgi:hypothetical protein